MRNFRILGFIAMLCFAECISAQNIEMGKKVMVGEGIAKFVPKGFEPKQMPSFALKKEPSEKGLLPVGWQLEPVMQLKDGKACAYLDIPQGTSLYGTGEVTGPLLRNGKTIKLWNTDSGAYGVDGEPVSTSRIPG